VLFWSRIGFGGAITTIHEHVFLTIACSRPLPLNIEEFRHVIVIVLFQLFLPILQMFNFFFELRPRFFPFILQSLFLGDQVLVLQVLIRYWWCRDISEGGAGGVLSWFVVVVIVSKMFSVTIVKLDCQVWADIEGRVS